MSVSNPPVFDGSTTDNYQYLGCYRHSRLTLQVSNAAIYIGFGVITVPGGSPVFPPVDEPFLPVVGSIVRETFDAIRFKSYTVGSPARVMIRAVR